MTDQQLLRASLIAVAVLLLAVLHFAVGTHTHPLHVVHVILAGLSLLPILAGAVWFGLRGGTLTASVVSVVYFAHMRLSWPDQPMENANQLAMIGVYLFVGTACGVLVAMQQREHQRRIATEQNAQREAIVQGLASLATALGNRDNNTLQHCRNVARLAIELGQRRGLPPERVELLRLAALVHDVGKIGVRDDVLLKPGKLSAEETEEVRRHPAIAADILRRIRGSEQIAAIVLAHHERLDGSGYPLGLSARDIPLEAQVLGVADTFCALTEQRPYRPALMSAAQALQIIEPMSGVRSIGLDVLTRSYLLIDSDTMRCERQET